MIGIVLGFMGIFAAKSRGVDITNDVAGVPRFILTDSKTKYRHNVDDILVTIPAQIVKEVDTQLGINFREAVVRTWMTHYENPPQFKLSVFGDAGASNGNVSVDQRYTYHNLFSTSDENHAYGLGLFLIKNLESGKSCIVRLELRLNKRKANDFDGITIDGTAPWSGPHTGEWNHVHGLGSYAWDGDPTISVQRNPPVGENVKAQTGAK